jgi:hypothetical protein
MLGMGMQGAQGVAGMTRGAMGDVANMMNANRSNSMAIDQMRNQAALGQYQGDIANRTAQNQFFTGLLGGGLGYNLGMQKVNSLATGEKPVDYFTGLGQRTGWWG